MSEPTSPIQLPQFHFKGSPQAVGHAHGETLRSLIKDFVTQRLDAASGFLKERQSDKTVEDFIAMGARSLAMVEEWDADGYEEHAAVAKAAGVDADQLYAAANLTDMRDALVFAPPVDDEGCTAALVPAGLSADGELWAAQTWDLNPPDLDFVVAIHTTPSEGPKRWTVTCAGCPSLMGINGQGVAVGTTNIKVRGARAGVGYMSLLHRALRSGSAKEAADHIKNAPRAAAHTYWLADASGALELEVSAHSVFERHLAESAIVRTNHCLAKPLQEAEAELPQDSSKARIRAMAGHLSREPVNLETIKKAFADRSQGILSISRYADDGQGTSTNACVVAHPKSKTLWACKGPSEHGRWVELLP